MDEIFSELGKHTKQWSVILRFVANEWQHTAAAIDVRWKL